MREIKVGQEKPPTFVTAQQAKQHNLFLMLSTWFVKQLETFSYQSFWITTTLLKQMCLKKGGKLCWQLSHSQDDNIALVVTQPATPNQLNADAAALIWNHTKLIRTWADFCATREINTVSIPVFHIYPNTGNIWKAFPGLHCASDTAYFIHSDTVFWCWK